MLPSHVSSTDPGSDLDTSLLFCARGGLVAYVLGTLLLKFLCMSHLRSDLVTVLLSRVSSTGLCSYPPLTMLPSMFPTLILTLTSGLLFFPAFLALILALNLLITILASHYFNTTRGSVLNTQPFSCQCSAHIVAVLRAPPPSDHACNLVTPQNCIPGLI